MKLIIFSLLFTTSAYAADSFRVNINTNDTLLMHKSNNKNIDDIEVQNTDFSGVIDAYKKCTDKGLIYLGAGASGVDADNCYDVANTTNPETRFRATFVGFLKGGDSTADVHEFYSGSSTVKGRFNADKKCNSEYPGSRTMVYDDLRYILPVLNTPANINTSPVWVYDNMLSYYSAANHTVTKDRISTSTNVFDCNGWNATSTATKGTVIVKTTRGAHTFFQIGERACNAAAYIACVKN